MVIVMLCIGGIFVDGDYYRGLMAEYIETISEYENIASEVSNLYNYLGNSSSIITECSNLMKDTIIDNEAIDKGKLDNISSLIESLRTLFNTIIAECQSQIIVYEGLYSSAAAMALQADSSSGETSS